MTWISGGYVYIYKPNHLNSNVRGWISESRYIMSNMINRPLKKGEMVHHRNGIKTDNRPENLKLLKGTSVHNKEHRKYKISYDDIKELIGNDVIYLTELQSKIMDKFGCCCNNVNKIIAEHMDKFKVWRRGKYKLFKNKVEVGCYGG